MLAELTTTQTTAAATTASWPSADGVGVVVQLGGCVLLVSLFVLLRRHAERRSYFRVWARAWFALAVSVGALVFRASVLPAMEPSASDETEPGVRALYLLYLFAKLLYFALLLAGTAMYAVGYRRRRLSVVAVVAAGVVASVALLTSWDLDAMVVLQSPFAVATFGGCAWTLLRLPASRQSVGSGVTAACFAALALIWIGYGTAFSSYEGDGHLASRALGLIVRYKAYVDLLTQMLVGYGMVVMLMEDAKREVDDAHTQLAVAHDRLRREALYDSLTGALNRRAFTEGVGLEAVRATFGTAVMLDLDNLKFVNDSFGHAAGDELLRHVGEVLLQTLRPSDRVYRWGGDEFLILLPGASPGEVQHRLEETLLSAPPLEIPAARRRIPLEASLGAARYTGAEALLPAIDAADAAMYEQKQTRKLGPAVPPRRPTPPATAVV